jgi:hypothetical protein
MVESCPIGSALLQKQRWRPSVACKRIASRSTGCCTGADVILLCQGDVLVRLLARSHHKQGGGKPELCKMIGCTSEGPNPQTRSLLACVAWQPAWCADNLCNSPTEEGVQSSTATATESSFGGLGYYATFRSREVCWCTVGAGHDAVPRCASAPESKSCNPYTTVMHP